MSATPIAGTDTAALSRATRLIPSLLTRFSTTIEVWIERSRQRRSLGELARNDHLLADIGLSLEQARREAAKPFWVSSKDGNPTAVAPDKSSGR